MTIPPNVLTATPLLLFRARLLGLLRSVVLADGVDAAAGDVERELPQRTAVGAGLGGLLQIVGSLKGECLGLLGSRSAAAAATRVAATISVVIGFFAIFFAPFTALATTLALPFFEAARLGLAAGAVPVPVFAGFAFFSFATVASPLSVFRLFTPSSHSCNVTLFQFGDIHGAAC